MKFTFPGFSEKMPALRLTFLEPGGALLSTPIHFFEHGRWGSPVETGVEGQRLTAEDQLFILMQAGEYLRATRGFATAEAQTCYQRVESLCHSLNRPLPVSAFIGQWLHSLFTDTVSKAMQIAKTNLLGRAAGERRHINDWSLSRFAMHALPFGRFRGRATIRNLRHSDLALVRRTLSGRRGHLTSRLLSDF